jgi:hypothetical protein
VDESGKKRAAAGAPLAWVERAVPWSVFEREGEATLRIFYVQSGSAEGPDAALAEVSVRESSSAVEVRLFERVLAGTYSDGSTAASAAGAVAACLEIALAQPLGERKVIDGTSGQSARTLDGNAPPGEGDWFLLRALARGCPRWVP